MKEDINRPHKLVMLIEPNADLRRSTEAELSEAGYMILSTSSLLELPLEEIS